MFWLINVTANIQFKMSSCGSKAGRRVYHWSMPSSNNSVLLHLTHQSDAAWNHSHPALLSRRLVAQDFVNRLDWGQWCSVATNLEVHRVHSTISFTVTVLSHWKQRCQGRHGSTSRIYQMRYRFLTMFTYCVSNLIQRFSNMKCRLRHSYGRIFTHWTCL